MCLRPLKIPQDPLGNGYFPSAPQSPQFWSSRYTCRSGSLQVRSASWFHMWLNICLLLLSTDLVSWGVHLPCFGAHFWILTSAKNVCTPTQWCVVLRYELLTMDQVRFFSLLLTCLRSVFSSSPYLSLSHYIFNADTIFFIDNTLYSLSIGIICNKYIVNIRYTFHMLHKWQQIFLSHIQYIYFFCLNFVS